MVVENKGRMKMGVEEGKGVMAMFLVDHAWLHIFLVVSINKAPESIKFSILALFFGMTVNVNVNATTQNV
jgi:hypothetical protein